MFSNPNINLLKALFNNFQIQVSTWQANAANALLAGNELQQTIALAKVEAYQDCANSVFNSIQQGY